MIGVVIVWLLLVFALAVFLVFFYGSRKATEWYTAVVVITGWFISLSILCLIPVDVTGNIYHNCVENDGEANCPVPLGLASDEFLFVFWRILYWTAFLMTWLFCPLLQSYVLAGGFTFSQRFYTSIKENLLLYGVLGAIGVAMMIWIAVANQMNLAGIMGFMMAVANCYGLFMLVAFMGYGLVEIPRKMWNSANRELSLKYLQFKAPTYVKTLQEVTTTLHGVMMEAASVSDAIPFHDPVRPWVDEILKKLPKGMDQWPRDDDFDKSLIDENYLISLNRRARRTMLLRNRASNHLKRLLCDAYHLQDIAENETKSRRVFASTLYGPHIGRFGHWRSQFDWYWFIWIEPALMRIWAVILGLVSLMVVWSEITFFIESPSLSIFELMIHSNYISNFGITILVLLILLYMSVCAYWSMLKMRLFNYYYVVPYHQTDSNSLLFAAAYLLRLTFPLCYNFLSMVGVENTNFQRMLGPLETIKILGAEFSVYFPISLIIVCLIVMFNVYSRLLNMCNISKFRFDEEFEHTSIEEGRQLINKERTIAERNPFLTRREFFQHYRKVTHLNDNTDFTVLVKQDKIVGGGTPSDVDSDSIQTSTAAINGASTSKHSSASLGGAASFANRISSLFSGPSSSSAKLAPSKTVHNERKEIENRLILSKKDRTLADDESVEDLVPKLPPPPSKGSSSARSVNRNIFDDV